MSIMEDSLLKLLPSLPSAIISDMLSLGVRFSSSSSSLMGYNFSSLVFLSIVVVAFTSGLSPGAKTLNLGRSCST